MANDPVLQRSMFQKQTSVAPSVGLGIGSVTTPDQNAKALKSMFQPTVSLGMPTQMLQQEQQPVQSFQEGGLATPLMRSRYEDPERRMRIEMLRRQAIDEADARRTGPEEPGIGTKIAASALDLTTIPYQIGAGLVGAKPTSMTPFYDEYVRRARGETATPLFNPFQKAGAATGDVLTAPIAAVQKVGSMIDPSEIPAPTGYTPRFDVLRRAEDENAQTQAAIRRQAIDDADERTRPQRGTATPPAPPPPAPEEKPREKGALELTLDGIKEERARSSEDKKQNALLALMQAGFAMAAGRSPNALSNIGAGGQAGIAAFASLEKSRREEQAALRRDELSIRLAQAKMQEDPETVKLFKSLGGGDLMKGFEMYNSDKKLQAATTLAKDITAPEEDRKAAAEYIRGQLMKARGGGSYSGFSATPVK
jgi:hypothetical protein